MTERVTVAVLAERFEGYKELNRQQHLEIRDDIYDVKITLEKCLMNRHPQPWSMKMKLSLGTAIIVACGSVAGPSIALFLGAR